MKLLLLFALAAAAMDDGAQARRYFYEDILTPFFRPDPLDATFMKAARPGSTAEPFQMPKPEGVYRIFILGGSIAQGFPGDTLQRSLQEAFDGKAVEAINCGMGGYDSHRELLLTQELLGYQPDALVLLSGHNEFVGSEPVSRWRLWLSSLRRGPPAVPDAGGQSARENAQRDAVFERNMRALLAAAKAKGVAVVVAIPPLNYRDALTRAAEPFSEPLFVSGWRDYLRGDRDGARERWREVARSAGSARARSPALFYLGRLAEEKKEWEEASRLYAEALDADPMGAQGAVPARLARLRALAAEGGALIADLDAAFRRRAAPRAPGLESFYDGVHWREPLHEVVALELGRALFAGAVPPGPPRPDDAQKGDKRYVDLLYALSEVEKRGARFSWYAANVFETLAAAHPKDFASPEGVLALAAKAQPHDNLSWRSPLPRVTPAAVTWYLGELSLRRRSWDEAAAAFERSRAADPSLVETSLHAALAHSLSGRAAEAEAALKRAAGERPFEERGLACGLGIRSDCPTPRKGP